MWDNRNYGFHPDQKIASVRPGSVKGEASEDGRRRGDGKRKEGKRFDGGGLEGCGGRKKCDCAVVLVREVMRMRAGEEGRILTSYWKKEKR